MTNDQPAIIVKNITKSFRIPLDKNPNLKQKILSGFRGKGFREFTSLKNVSFTINKGDFFGIVGRNGSGKSTLLKTIAGIYAPDSGHVKLDGLLVPFIELGVGFNPELSGRENVYLNGALLGFSRSEIDSMYEEIVDFAELHNFMEERLRNYSSGMQVRLAFSIAIRARGDILLLDEVLAVGDAAFQQKCFDYFEQLKRDKKTVILVTHSMSHVQRFCDKALLIDQGVVKEFGDVEKVTKLYKKLNEAVKPGQKQTTSSHEDGNDNFNLVVRTTNQTGDKKSSFGPDDRICLDVTIEAKKDIDEDILVEFMVKRNSGDTIFWTSTKMKELILDFTKETKQQLRLDIQNIFGDNDYIVSIAIKNIEKTNEYLVSAEAASFTVNGWGKNGHMLHPDHKISVTKK